MVYDFEKTVSDSLFSEEIRHSFKPTFIYRIELDKDVYLGLIITADIRYN